MTHHRPLSHDTAAELVRLAWDRTDFLADLLPYSIYYASHIRQSVFDAADIYTDKHDREPTEAEIKRAQLLLELEADVWIQQWEKARADALADAIDAGDCDAAGSVVPYSRYRRV